MAKQWLAGHFLVASRQLTDPNFAETVVLMIHHDHQGAMGLVLNRPSDKSVLEVWELIGYDPCDREDCVFVGGPVPGPLVALHSLEVFSDHEVIPGLHVSSNRDSIDILVRKKQLPLRLCSGNAGWASGQLEREMEAGGWLWTRATIEEVFSDHESMWKQVTSRIGLEIIAPPSLRHRIPSDPSLN